MRLATAWDWIHLLSDGKHSIPDGAHPELLRAYQEMDRMLVETDETIADQGPGWALRPIGILPPEWSAFEFAWRIYFKSFFEKDVPWANYYGTDPNRLFLCYSGRPDVFDAYPEARDCARQNASAWLYLTDPLYLYATSYRAGTMGSYQAKERTPASWLTWAQKTFRGRPTAQINPYLSRLYWIDFFHAGERQHTPLVLQMPFLCPERTNLFPLGEHEYIELLWQMDRTLDSPRLSHLQPIFRQFFRQDGWDAAAWEDTIMPILCPQLMYKRTSDIVHMFDPFYTARGDLWDMSIESYTRWREDDYLRRATFSFEFVRPAG